MWPQLVASKSSQWGAFEAYLIGYKSNTIFHSLCKHFVFENLFLSAYTLNYYLYNIFIFWWEGSGAWVVDMWVVR
jgi:hypothetical protein